MSKVDYSNGSDIIAEIIFNQDPDTYYRFNTQDEGTISEFLYEKIGEAECEVNGVPWFIEASSWCPLACIGEIFEAEELFTIKIINIEN